MSTKQARTIADLREKLFDTIDEVKAGKVDLAVARQVGELAQVIVNTAKVEVDYLKANNGGEMPFLEPTGADNLPPGITGTTVHRLK